MGIAFTVREKMDEIGGKEDNWKRSSMKFTRCCMWTCRNVTKQVM
jgi:hypothetical protein